MKFRREVLYRLQFDEEGALLPNNFNKNRFSRFKYGEFESTQYFAFLLAKEILNVLGDRKAILLSSSAYRQVPTAAANLSEVVATILSVEGVQVIKKKIVRKSLHDEDYSRLAADEREGLMQKNNLQMVLDLEEWENNLPHIICDDLYVTGAHERNIRRYIAAGSETIFFYIADLSRLMIPGLEYSLNHCMISEIEDLCRVLKSKDHYLNTRICKYILRYPRGDRLKESLGELPSGTLFAMKEAMEADELHLLDALKPNYDIVCQLMPRLTARKSA